MVNAGEILKGTMNRLGLGLKIKSHQIWQVWDKAVGPSISSVAQPEDIKFKTLFVRVSDSIWIVQLKYLETMLIDKLNDSVGAKVIQKIYFRLGDFKNENYGKAIRRQNKNNVQLTHQRPAESILPEIDLSSIKDADLKQIIRRLILKAATTERI
jgi:predicted nucleic acid-binding Zn ribbon protein